MLQNKSSSVPGGSATGNPRNKVALRPGHSLMDWIRLGQSGIDLTGVGGVRQDVTVAQLAAHNTRQDAWIAIRGIVYNVTHYMDFHPGGTDELMKGVGRDATDLFNQVHAWVNYDSILKKCTVGRLKRRDSGNEDLRMHLFGSKRKLLFQANDINDSSSLSAMKKTVPSPRMDWYQKLSSLSLVFYTRVLYPYAKVCLSGDRELRVFIKIGDENHMWHYNLTDDVMWPCNVSVSKEKVEVQFSKKTEKMWETIGTPCDDNATSSKFQMGSERHLMTIDAIIEVTYNTRLFVLSYTEKMYCVIPLGHHIRIHADVEGVEVIRNYTPIPPSLHMELVPPEWRSDSLCLMVKQYADGQLTPWLFNLSPGRMLEVSGPEGTFQQSRLVSVSHLYLLAAGTGLTPMLSLVKWGLDRCNNTCQNVSLMFFNCKEEDILWKDQLDILQREDNRFSVVYVLSEAVAGWTGLRGRIDISMLQNFLPKVDSISCSYFVCVCGPVAFTKQAELFLKEMNYTEGNYHCFLG